MCCQGQNRSIFQSSLTFFRFACPILQYTFSDFLLQSTKTSNSENSTIITLLFRPSHAFFIRDMSEKYLGKKN